MLKVAIGVTSNHDLIANMDFGYIKYFESSIEHQATNCLKLKVNVPCSLFWILFSSIQS